MALVKGICKNFGECDMADNKEVQEVEKSNFVCEECGKPLHPVDGGSKTTGTGNGGGGANKKLLGLIAAAVVLLAGAGFGIYKLIGGGPEIDKIKLDPKSIALEVGQRNVIKATVVDKDGKEITDAKVVYKWTVKDEKVASVTQGGEVAALKKGKTSITVKIEGDDTHRATCQVEVKAPMGQDKGQGGDTEKDVLITSLSVENSQISLVEGGQAELKVNIEPAGYTEGISVESSDPEVAMVENNVIIAKKAGSAQIVIKTEKSGTSASIAVTVSKKSVDPEPKPKPMNPSWGRYEGARQGGKPHGNGVLYITRQHTINGETAQPGERIQGVFRNGYVNMGTWFKKDGNAVVVKDVKVL